MPYESSLSSSTDGVDFFPGPSDFFFPSRRVRKESQSTCCQQTRGFAVAEKHRTSTYRNAQFGKRRAERIENKSCAAAASPRHSRAAARPSDDLPSLPPPVSPDTLRKAQPGSNKASPPATDETENHPPPRSLTREIRSRRIDTHAQHGQEPVRLPVTKTRTSQSRHDKWVRDSAAGRRNSGRVSATSHKL